MAVGADGTKGIIAKGQKGKAIKGTIVMGQGKWLWTK